MIKGRYKFHNIITNVIISLFISIGFSQNLESFMQKTTLENSLREKIYSEVGHIIDRTKFVVVVNLELENKNLGEEINQFENSNSQGTDLAAQAPLGNSMNFIPGIQLSGANGNNQKNDIINNQNLNSTQRKSSFGNLGSMNIKKINVNFFLEESLSSPTLDKTITTMVNEMIPMISSCDDCISIETMKFQKSSEKTELKVLYEKIETMEAERREEQLENLDKKFDDLQEKLSRSEEQREMWEDQAIFDREFQRRQDSLRLLKLETHEEDERHQLDTLLFNTQLKLDTVINARITSETETKKDLIDIIKYGQGNLSNEETQGLFGMKGGGATDSTLLYIVFGLIIFFMLLILLLKKNKNEIVYLKPKGSKSKKKGKNIESESKEPIIETSNNPYTTMAFEDENVIRAELKALRESAVSMSVNQREGATQIVKDWLSDSLEEKENE